MDSIPTVYFYEKKKIMIGMLDFEEFAFGLALYFLDLKGELWGGKYTVKNLVVNIYTEFVYYLPQFRVSYALVVCL